MSASTGKLELNGDLHDGGKKFSKLLNIFFNQKHHAKTAWLYLQAQKELERKFDNDNNK